MNWKDIGTRALKTAVQASLAVATVEVFAGGDIEALRTAATAGLAGAASVVHNALLTWSTSDA
ncbi:MAG TPA: hypothetical protein VM784_04140 [Actinomycetota bacterium]|nr:hypothetical protein [Actinomycetota bacterium]